MTIKELVSICYQQAKEKGWARDGEVVPVPEQISLIHAEASEALEEWRNRKPLSYTGEDGKPEGLAVEYADIVIRIGHYCASMEIDLEYELLRKLAYNRTRPYRHGGKLA